MPAEDRRQVGTTINGRSYDAKDGFFDMPPADARLHLKSAEMPRWQSFRGAYTRRNGYRCADCGFGSFFKKCSRCGGTCEREGTHAPTATQDA